MCRRLASAATRPALHVFVNPEFVERDGMQLEEEGCLSVPGFNATVARPARVVVKGLDRDGDEHTVEGTGLLARCFQHEMDHLDGTAVRGPAPRPAEGPDRPQDQEAGARRQMVAALRVAFFGTPQFAVPSLEALLGVARTRCAAS